MLPARRLCLYTYPIIALTTFVPAALAAFGFYITGILLAYQMLRSVWVLLAVVVLAGLLVRWRAVRQRKVADSSSEADPTLEEAEDTASVVRSAFGLAPSVLVERPE